MIQHPKTQELHLYWRQLRGFNAAPHREDIRPQDIKALLPNVFLLEPLDFRHYIFRLAGTAFCARYGREFRDHNFLSLWQGDDFRTLQDALRTSSTNCHPILVHNKVKTIDNVSYDAELILLPLLGSDERIERILGGSWMLSTASALQGKTIVDQSISAIQWLAGANDNHPLDLNTNQKHPHLRLVSSNV